MNYKPNPDAPTCVVLDEAVTSGRMADIYNLKIHPEDIFVASFPKSGTTWLQQVVYLLLNDKNSQQGMYYYGINNRCRMNNHIKMNYMWTESEL